MYTERERESERKRERFEERHTVYFPFSKSIWSKRRGTGLRMGGKRRGRREKRWTKERGEKAEKRA